MAEEIMLLAYTLQNHQNHVIKMSNLNKMSSNFKISLLSLQYMYFGFNTSKVSLMKRHTFLCKVKHP